MEEDTFGPESAAFVEFRVYEHWMMHYRCKRLATTLKERDRRFWEWRDRYREIVEYLVSDGVINVYWHPRSAVGRILPSRVRHPLIAILACAFDRMVREQEGLSG